MIDFQLFRIKVFPSKQGHLFKVNLKPHELLRAVISSAPSAEFRKGTIWHIGNLLDVNESGLYFRFGKKSKLELQFYKNGDFLDKEIEAAPYTHVLLNIPLEIVAIAKKPKLSQKPYGIGKFFVKLLNESELAKEYDAKFEIAEMKDPTDFITHLHQSISISKFWVSFSRPNAWDVNEDFIKPSEKLLEESLADKGKTTIEGDNLNPDSLEDLARSAASTGNDAAAWLYLPNVGSKIRKSLKGNPVTFSCEDISEEKHKKEILFLMKEIYKKIRGANK